MKTQPGGGLSPVTFFVGKDFAAACQRVVLLEQMWVAIQKEWAKCPHWGHPVWSSSTHQIALAVARGESPIYLDLPDPLADRLPGQRDETAAMHFGFLKELYPFLDIRPASEEDREAAVRGAEALAASAMSETKAAATANRALGRSFGGMLHATLDTYSAHLAKRCEPDQARTQANLVKLLKSQLEDQSLTLMTADRMEAVLWFFANRPPSKHDGQPLAFYTCRNVLITFRAFLRWLNRSEAHGWELPRAFEFPRVKIKKLPPTE